VPTGSEAPKRFRLPIRFTLPADESSERPNISR
jgi:hypothetical protein